MLRPLRVRRYGWIMGLLFALAVLYAAFASITWGNTASAHVIDPACTSAGISLDIRGEFQGTSDEAALGHDETFPGGADVIDYIVTVSLSATQCPITDGEPVLTLPDGTVVDLDDGLALASGGSITYDVTGSPYTIDSSDLGSLAGAAANEVRATASITATSHRASGLDQDVAASVNFDTLVSNPGTVVSISASAETIASGDSVTLTIAEENTGDDPLTNPFVELAPLGLTLDETSAEFTGGDNGNGVLDPGEIWTWDVTDTPAGDTTYTATGHGTDSTGADVTFPDFPDEQDAVSVTVEERGFEGCTPGFWKNHPAVWQGFTPGQTLESVFDVPDGLGLDDTTLLEALSLGGGSGVQGASQILLRAAAAALLNAAHPDVEYPHTVADVIADVNAALASGNRATILNLAADLDEDNNLGCSIDAHGNPID